MGRGGWRCFLEWGRAKFGSFFVIGFVGCLLFVGIVFAVGLVGVGGGIRYCWVLSLWDHDFGFALLFFLFHRELILLFGFLLSTTLHRCA